MAIDLLRFPLRHVHNPKASRQRAYGDAERSILSLDAFRAAKAEITSWPGYAPTPLVSLPGLADVLGLGGVRYKDEGKRFALKSFKALGGAYAVLRVLQNHLADRYGLTSVGATDLISGCHRDKVADVTVVCATDGNHGRSVAWGAQMFGCRCRIYLHTHVSARREQEIARFGAQIVRVEGSYDDSVRRCAEEAACHHWVLVADTSSGGGDARVPAMVMQGYTVMVDEMLEQFGQPPPTHIFIQGGVGGLAAAIAGHAWEALGPRRPRFVIVEPVKADCIFRSIAAGRPVAVTGDINTFMACLAAGEVSPVAWPILEAAADDVIALPDEAAEQAMRVLAAGMRGDPPLVSGESGSAATAGLIAAALDPVIRKALALDETARVVVIGSEGATDPETYENVVGIAPERVGETVV